MTKEPKLTAAMRIVPEWKDYDTEIRNLMENWQHEVAHNATKANNDSKEKRDEL